MFWSGATERKYYYAGTQRVAMRVDNTVYYLLSDQLGSTTITTDAQGGSVSELRYDAWGVVRYSSGTTPTKNQYTGQYSNVADFGLMFYNARWYDPGISRWVQPDSIVPDPGSPQAWDRYAYVMNRPTVLTDPSGHDPWWCDTARCEAKYLYRTGPEYIDALAKWKGVHLAPGDHWAYAASLAHRPGGDLVGGWTPRNRSWNPDERYYYDKDSNQYLADDSAVYITGETLCNQDPELAATVIAHEAGHSWIEHTVEKGTPTTPITQIDNIVETSGEEGFVNGALLNSPAISDAVKQTELQPRVNEADAFMLKWTGKPSSGVLKFFYGIEYTQGDLLKDIYGLNYP